VVAERPAVATRDDRIEAALRRASAHRVLRGAAAGSLALLAGLLYAAGTSLHSFGAAPGHTPAAVLGVAGSVVGLAAAAVAVTAVVVACFPAPKAPTGDAVPAA
jgi:predicted component of type VI protein secretion system